MVRHLEVRYHTSPELDPFDLGLKRIESIPFHKMRGRRSQFVGALLYSRNCVCVLALYLCEEVFDPEVTAGGFVESVLDDDLFKHHLLQHGLEGGPENNNRV